MPQGTIKATVLIETILAAFEMDEILYELRDHSAGLNAGRWDYIFSVIKKLGHRPEFVLPDRAQVTMAVPFMRAYTRAARARPATGAARTRSAAWRRSSLAARPRGERGRAREGARGQGARGRRTASTAPGSRTPTSSPVAMRVVRRACSASARTRSSGSATTSTVDAADAARRRRDAGRRSPRRACATTSRSGSSTSPPGCSGSGAVAIYNLMEDAATAEISRSQVWQWLRHGRVDARGRRAGSSSEEIGEARTATTPTRARSSSRSRIERRVRRVPDAAGVRPARRDRELSSSRGTRRPRRRSRRGRPRGRCDPQARACSGGVEVEAPGSGSTTSRRSRRASGTRGHGGAGDAISLHAAITAVGENRQRQRPSSPCSRNAAASSSRVARGVETRLPSPSRVSIASSGEPNERSPRRPSARSVATGGSTCIAGSRRTARSTRSGCLDASSATSRPPKLCPIQVAAPIPWASAVSSRSARCVSAVHGASHGERP